MPAVNHLSIYRHNIKSNPHSRKGSCLLMPLKFRVRWMYGSVLHKLFHWPKRNNFLVKGISKLLTEPGLLSDKLLSGFRKAGSKNWLRSLSYNIYNLFLRILWYSIIPAGNYRELMFSMHQFPMAAGD